ncbi:alpha/beta hydrolase [bacterium]|nr:alpha/beta hydrolase [bacterium]
MLSMLLSSLMLTLGQDPYSLPGSFAWGERQVSVPNATGGSQSAKLYYPAVSQGTGTDLSPSGGPFPVVTFAHGFFATPAFYDSFCRQLATRGYLVISTDSQGLSFNPNRLQYISDVKDTITYLIDQNSTPGSVLQGRVDTAAIGISGHSLGGGIASVVAAEDSRVKALATFSSVTLRSSGPLGTAPPPYADDAVSKLDIPVSFINGSLDQLVPVSSGGQPLFNAASGPKLLPNVIGGYHVGFTDFPFTPPLGDFGQPGSISLEENQAFGRAELASFFDLYLKGDQSAWRRQWGPERFALAGVINQVDPGFSITLNADNLVGLPGQQKWVDITIQNTSDHSDSYSLFAEDNLWSLNFSLPSTSLLAPGQQQTLSAWVTIPSSPASLTDLALVSARSNLDGGTRAFTYLRTSVPEASSLVLAGGAILVAGASVIGRRKSR